MENTKSITDLLQRMNESEKFEHDNYSIQIFSDKSGCVKYEYNGVYGYFGVKKRMNILLDEIDAELKGETTEWTL